MKHLVLLIFLGSFSLTSCDIFVTSLNGCFLNIPDDLGYYEIKQIPNYTVNVGDTVWISMNDYFKSRDRCDYGYADIDLEIIDMNYDLAHFIQSERFLLIAANKIGETDVNFRGSIRVRRDGEDIIEHETRSFTLNIVEGSASSNVKPNSALSPFFAVDSVKVETRVRNVSAFIELSFFFNKGYFDDEYYSVYTFWNEDVTESIENYIGYNSGATDEYGASFRWDSLTTSKFIKLRRSNRATWISETESYQEGISSYVQNFLKIESYPNDKPVIERNFSITGF